MTFEYNNRQQFIEMDSQTSEPTSNEVVGEVHGLLAPNGSLHPDVSANLRCRSSSTVGCSLTDEWDSS